MTTFPHGGAAAVIGASGSPTSPNRDNAVVLFSDYESRIVGLEGAAVSGLTMFADVVAGLAGTSEGEYFTTPGAEDEVAAILYKNVAGVAVEQRRFAGDGHITATIGGLYPDVAAGIAGTESGGHFGVFGTGSTALTIYENVDDVATKRADVAAVSDTAKTDLRLAQVKWRQDAREQYAALPAAILAISDGQSNAEDRGPGTSNRTVSTDWLMFTGGEAIQDMQFVTDNDAHVVEDADVASLVTFDEGDTDEGFGWGWGSRALGRRFRKGMYVSPAKGGKSISDLMDRGYMTNRAAAYQRAGALLRAQSLEPVPAAVIVHGERAMSDGDSEAKYKADFAAFLKRQRMLARIARQDPEYIMPQCVIQPLQSFSSSPPQDVIKAMNSVVFDEPGVFFGPALYPHACEGDHVHIENEGKPVVGEAIGLFLERWFDGEDPSPPIMIDVQRDGANFRIRHSLAPGYNLVHDTSVIHATGLSAADTLAQAGFIWKRGGSTLSTAGSSITSVNGNEIVGTLDSDPGSVLADEAVEYGMQLTPATNTATTAFSAGGRIRSDRAGEKSAHDSSFTHLDFANRAVVSVRAPS